MRTIIVGGGYAGLSCLLQLHRQYPEADIHLIDAGKTHIKHNHLHQTLSRSLEDFSVSYATLAERLRFTFHHFEISWNEAQLRQWNQTRSLPLANGPLSFDFLVLATGSQPIPLPSGDYCYGLNDFRRGQGLALMEEFRERIGDRPARCTVVGSGPSGIQFLFALYERLKSLRIVNQLQLVSLDQQLVADQPPGFHQKLLKAMDARGMRFFPATRYLGQEGNCLQLQPVGQDAAKTLESDLTLLFPGVAPRPTRLRTNPIGQVQIGGQSLDGIFSAGDCANFCGTGLNALTAQAAVKKGKLVAANVAALANSRTPAPYDYRERGFFLALGPFDGLGWFGRHGNLVGGLAAMAAKELLEAQYDLLLEGLDTFGL